MGWGGGGGGGGKRGGQSPSTKSISCPFLLQTLPELVLNRIQARPDQA